MHDVMIVRWYRSAAVVVGLSLLVTMYLVFFYRHQLLTDICPDSSQLLHQLPQSTQFSENTLSLHTIVSIDNSKLGDFEERAVLRPTDSLPTVATAKLVTTTNTLLSVARRQFVFHHCPATYSISDAQDEWFRTAVVQRSPMTSQVSFTEEILILTPMCNAQQHLRRYFENLCSLAYPHRLISVVIGEDSSTDNTVQVN